MVDSHETTLLLDFTTAEAPQPYVYGAACRVNPETGDLYLSITKGSAWGDESELRVYSTTDATMKASYPMEKHYWFPEMPILTQEFCHSHHLIYKDEVGDIILFRKEPCTCSENKHHFAKENN